MQHFYFNFALAFIPMIPYSIDRREDRAMQIIEQWAEAMGEPRNSIRAQLVRQAVVEIPEQESEDENEDEEVAA